MAISSALLNPLTLPFSIIILLTSKHVDLLIILISNVMTYLQNGRAAKLIRGFIFLRDSQLMLLINGNTSYLCSTFHLKELLAFILSSFFLILWFVLISNFSQKYGGIDDFQLSFNHIVKLRVQNNYLFQFIFFIFVFQ